MSQSTSKAIKAIMQFKRDFEEIDPKVPNKLVGELGELLTFQELKKNKFKATRKGGHSGYDIYLEDKKARIEVRTSLLKEEGVYGNPRAKYWGWKIETQEGKDVKKFDYIVLVALGSSFRRRKFYVLSYEETKEIQPVTKWRFNNVRKKIHLFENKEGLGIALQNRPHLVTKFEKHFNSFSKKYLGRWNKIK